MTKDKNDARQCETYMKNNKRKEPLNKLGENAKNVENDIIAQHHQQSQISKTGKCRKTKIKTKTQRMPTYSTNKMVEDL